ncbi:MAG TPA: enolase C-terminal domain-like protein, partial [Dyadobacter sp.]|nr:enolase C-terminal domain-like protein [Dyadobacter sp.]
MKSNPKSTTLSRRAALQSVLGVAATGTMLLPKTSYAANPGPFQAYGKVKITKLETFLVKPRWIFLKIHTDAGIVGLGEPLLEGRALTIQTAIKEVEPYLVGKDPRAVVHHWQAIYRHAFYRGGPLLTSALSGIDQALWDIKGKLLGVPVHELLGGPTRDRVRIYGRASNAEDMKKRKAEGYTIIKTGVAKKNPANIVENPAFIKYASDNFASLREAGGPEMDIAIDFHGAVPQQTSKVLIKELEQYQPFFVEEPCQAQNIDTLVDIARGTHIPIATGERIFTKWGFREILEKG